MSKNILARTSPFAGMKKTLLFVSVAAVTGIISSSIIYAFLDDDKEECIKGKTIAISREATEQILAADNNMQRELAIKRQQQIASQNAEGRIAKSELALGSIAYGMGEREVIEILGKPQKIERERDIRYAGKEVSELDYGSIEISIVDGVVRQLKLNEDSKLTTLAGVAVGMGAGSLLAVYGEPSLKFGDDYIYFLEGEPTVGMTFEIEQGFIENIKIGDLGL